MKDQQYIEMCRAKIHRATVTQADLEYEGSITIDPDLLDASGILPYEKVQVLNLNTGHRIETYVIVGEQGSGVICLNGPAARLGAKGDEVIIIAYSLMPEEDARRHEPKIVMVDKKNRVKDVESL